MSFGPTEIALVRNSFAQIEPIAPQAATMFYAHLFRVDPKLRALFRGDMRAQGAKLMQMIGAAVALLDRPEQLLPVLRKLGARHQGYGVKDEHYASVGAALIQTLEQGLGPAFTPAARVAWLAVYELVCRTMQAAEQPQSLAA
ncbi:MAG TPA: globin family protein [Roseateles sp.]|nr:globin family protein [Roseateles sp.]